VTVQQQVAEARLRLVRAGIPEAEANLDARLLAQYVLRWDAATYFRDAPIAAPQTFNAAFDALVRRREHREPTAYILERQEFWGLDFEVSPAVLIPRPETELIVETAVDLLPERQAAMTIADACTGSGCLAVALAREYPRAQIFATDQSADALGVARRNASKHQVDDRVTFVLTDALADAPGPFQLIVANPPYVPDGERLNLPPEVKDHEPALALYGGSDGLRVVRTLLHQASARLRAGGLLLFEIGAGQAALVADLIETHPELRLVAFKEDLQGIPRAAVVTRNGT
jgi:release factor glutamine methyltransferase